MRRLRLHRRTAQGNAGGARAGPGGRPEGPAGRARSARARSSTSVTPTSGASASAPAFTAPSHAPIPGEEFSRTELLAAEKESIGLFISAHPLKDVGPALRAESDSSLAELAARRDGDWVTVGGMVTQAKRFKTKKGDWMMFASLYDLEASVEIIVFDKALTASQDALATDSIVLVRGKVDHKDRDKTCIVAQQVERFEPSQEEVLGAQVQAAKQVLAPSALRLRLDATALAATRPGRAQGAARRLPGRIRCGDRARHHRRPAPSQARSELPGAAQRQPARRARRPARGGSDRRCRHSRRHSGHRQRRLTRAGARGRGRRRAAGRALPDVQIDAQQQQRPQEDRQQR